MVHVTGISKCDIAYESGVPCLFWTCRFIDPTESSKAWIAGVVFGVISAIGIIGLAMWFYIRKRRAAATERGNMVILLYYFGKTCLK